MRTSSLLVVTLLAVSAAAEDVEHPPVVIEPPQKNAQPRKPSPPPDAEKTGPARVPAMKGSRVLLTPHRLRLDASLLLDTGPTEPTREPTELERVKSRIDGYFDDLMARQRAKRGNVDPGWHYLAGRMDHYFEPEFSHVGDPRITEVSGAWLGKTLWDWLGGWYQNASSTGSDGYTPVERDPYMHVDTTAFDIQQAAYADEAYGATITAVVEIRIGADGELGAKLFRSSGYSRFDQEAMQGVAKAIENTIDEELPPGPARSLYALSARYAILPPLPVVGFSFDLLLGHFDLMYPCKKMVNGKARLLAVYRGKRKPPEPQ